MFAQAVTAGVYVHLPFCPHVCPYCDFAKWAFARPDADRYLAALRAEIAGAPQARGTTVFFGGGTPNTYDAATIGGLIAALRARFAIPAGAEISLEINPDLALCEELPALRAAGVNRLSIGVQSIRANCTGWAGAIRRRTLRPSPHEPARPASTT